MATADDFLRRLGRRLRSLRDAKGWSLADMAKRSGYERGYIGEVERGKKNVPILTLRVLAEALGVTIETVLAGISKGRHPKRPSVRAVPRHIEALANELGSLSLNQQRRILPAIRSLFRAAGVRSRKRIRR